MSQLLQRRIRRTTFLSALPQGCRVWIQVLPRASVAGYVKIGIEFQQKGDTSGTTVTFNVSDR
ncbi:putative protein phosphatase 2C family [Helianthus annuus]|uniref:Uncharacterized protein n=1 Tax=Helianthus annuus TaxID=4232 RepID=A0A9K3HEM4_HELAN|nr:putative protein phosphatase 2C family [Helianthus annuus]KAJ0479055.1 hypothetical protein HanHA300_Chr13g0506641 [Helianthus annuus]KAJ0665894.1 hypothetical protein HanLR1_Chr13g0508751 [Helianthus annuus]KAJ0851678.1 putative protein phosphatase 2C family [Helianthus annuus]